MNCICILLDFMNIESFSCFEINIYTLIYPPLLVPWIEQEPSVEGTINYEPSIINAYDDVIIIIIRLRAENPKAEAWSEKAS